MSNFKIDFIGIGANKAGTSWVNRVLSAHPQICTAEPKEVHFFHDKDSFTRDTHKGNFAKGISWYKRFFSHCPKGKIIGEFTPKYMIDENVPERIKKMFPDVKLILCMRSPVDRAISQYHFEKHFIKRETRPMNLALRQESIYIENGLYFQALQRYLKYFPFTRIHLIWFEDIRERPETVVRALYSFLEVNPEYVPASIYKKQNASKRSKSKWVQDFLADGERFLSSAGLARLVRWMKIIKINKLISYFNAEPITYNKATEEDEAWMKEQFREDILNLEKLTGRDLSSWLA